TLTLKGLVPLAYSMDEIALVRGCYRRLLPSLAVSCAHARPGGADRTPNIESGSISRDRVCGAVIKQRELRSRSHGEDALSCPPSAISSPKRFASSVIWLRLWIGQNHVPVIARTDIVQAIDRNCVLKD